jgi:general secretion pathway protein K
VRDERGFALIAALWLLVVLSSVGLELSLAARDRRLVALNAAERAQAAWGARAGLEVAHARLERLLADSAAPNTDRWWNASGFLPDTVRDGESSFAVVARDANARLNVNRASEAELRNLFAALRVDATRADSLAQSILDWIDPDDLHRPRGAERQAYLAAGLPVLPRNGPFRSLPELLDVMGMTPELFARVSPYLTVTGTGEINVNAAPREVLLALSGMTEQAVAVIEARRGTGSRITSLDDLTQRLSSSARALLQAHNAELLPRLSFETRELELQSTGWTGDGRVPVVARGLLIRARTTAFLFGVSVE